jgi:RNA-binding protein
MTAAALTKKQLAHLRGLAHDLDPIVQVGKAGVTDPVVAAVGRALLDHELIKVRLLEPEDKRGMAAELAERSTSALCGLIGHTVILYKKHPKKPRIAV